MTWCTAGRRTDDGGGGGGRRRYGSRLRADPVARDAPVVAERHGRRDRAVAARAPGSGGTDLVSRCARLARRAGAGRAVRSDERGFRATHWQERPVLGRDESD